MSEYGADATRSVSTREPLTVGDLRAALAGWPDEASVAVIAQQPLDESSWVSLDVVAAGRSASVPRDQTTVPSAFPLVAARPGEPSGIGREPWRHVATLCVSGIPATYSTAAEKPWREAVRTSVAAAVPGAASGVFAVRLAFVTPRPRRQGESWDLDNLVKCTIDALEGALGTRIWKGPPQVADHLVVHLQATKREVVGDEPTGATIEIWSRESVDS